MKKLPKKWVNLRKSKVKTPEVNDNFIFKAMEDGKLGKIISTILKISDNDFISFHEKWQNLLIILLMPILLPLFFIGILKVKYTDFPKKVIVQAI